MSYTVVRVVDAGVLLFRQHEQRMARGGAKALAAFREFAASATAGIYSLSWSDTGGLEVVRRPSSRYFDGMPVRFAVSPAVATEPKSPPPNIYTPTRVDGVATLLTSVDGLEIYESCSAGVIAWDGTQLVVPPEGRPRTVSTTEVAFREALDVREAPLLAASGWPLGAINAVVGLCLLDVPGRVPFSSEQVVRVRHVFEASARRS